MPEDDITLYDLNYVIDLCKIAITKKDPGIRSQPHDFVAGHAWDERRTLEVAYYTLEVAAQTALNDIRTAEAYVNRVLGMLIVFGVGPNPEGDDEAKAALQNFGLFPPGKARH